MRDKSEVAVQTNDVFVKPTNVENPGTGLEMPVTSVRMKGNRQADWSITSPENGPNIQIVTGIEVNSESNFPKLREYCPSAEGTRAIFPQLREIRLTIDR